MTEKHPKFYPGEKAQFIVGMPGPDFDECEIIKENEDGTYQIKSQVWGQGPWYEDMAFPNVFRIGGLFKKFTGE